MTLWLYPVSFRHAFGQELIVTFRSRVEDVLEGGGIRAWLAFAVEIAVDMPLAYRELLKASGTPRAGTILGLTEGATPDGCLGATRLDVSLLFAAAGLALVVVGWYAYFVILPTYVS
ncbi:hypothetical protein [Luteitalea sp.]